MIGLLFMLAAPLRAKYVDGSPWAPAVFGASWAITLAVVGRRYRRLGRLNSEVSR
jgi:hypothetical protein